jgi:hypothetical protein
VTIERLSDNEGKKGDVTDIRLRFDNRTENLSIKHNHKALKHQRPSATPKQCGFKKTSIESINFKSKYKKITSKFSSFQCSFPWRP